MIERLASHIVEGRKVLLWVGAGNSYPAIPTDTDNQQGLAYTLALIHYENDPAQIEAELGHSFRLSELAGKIGKARVRDLILQQGWMDIQLRHAHRAIAALAEERFHLEIVTVNYDPLLERALTDEGLEPMVIFSAAQCQLLAEDHPSVVKIHGCPFRDNNPDNLVMLAQELENPPAWVTTFLNCRQLERVFVYIGFSGNAPYVRNSITAISKVLAQHRIGAFGVDVRSTDEVFDSGDEMGDFYAISGVPRENYSGIGSDAFLNSLADAVFRRILEKKLEEARVQAEEHGCPDFEWLREILTRMNYDQIRAFGHRVGAVGGKKHHRIRDLAIRNALYWILIFCCRGILDRQNLRPVLAPAYRPGPHGTASAPIFLVDGRGQEAVICRQKLAADKQLCSTFQVSGEPRWYAVILNCTGTLRNPDLSVIQRGAESAAQGYDPALFVDENSMFDADSDHRLAQLFQL